MTLEHGFPALFLLKKRAVHSNSNRITYWLFELLLRVCVR